MWSRAAPDNDLYWGHQVLSLEVSHLWNCHPRPFPSFELQMTRTSLSSQPVIMGCPLCPGLSGVTEGAGLVSVAPYVIETAHKVPTGPGGGVRDPTWPQSFLLAPSSPGAATGMRSKALSPGSCLQVGRDKGRVPTGGTAAPTVGPCIRGRRAQESSGAVTTCTPCSAHSGGRRA